MNVSHSLVVFLCSAIAIGFADETSAGPAPAQKCLASKLKEMAKYDTCRLKADAKAASQGGAPDFSRCGTKLTEHWSRIEGSGGCARTGDQAAAQAEADRHTAEVVRILTSEPVPITCGNGTLEIGEQCDGSELNGLGCYALGFLSSEGALACDAACNFDTSGCVAGGTCGDGIANADGENCDGADLGGYNCTNFGATGGALACDADCRYDFAGCGFTCGDSSVDLGEECDGPAQFATCTSLGFAGGTLACTGACTFDTSGCTATCGDEITSPAADEQCDGTDLGIATTDCASLGYTSGALGCTGGCQWDTSACTLECDYLDQDCPGGDGCYLSVFGNGGCQPPGTAGPLEACSVQSDCAPRSLCIPTGAGPLSVCLPLCDSSIGDSDCPGGFGFTCQASTSPAEPNLGICL